MTKTHEGDLMGEAGRAYIQGIGDGREDLDNQSFLRKTPDDSLGDLWEGQDVKTWEEVDEELMSFKPQLVDKPQLVELAETVRADGKPHLMLDRAGDE